MPRRLGRALVALFVTALVALGPAELASAQGLLPGLLSPPPNPPAPPPPPPADVSRTDSAGLPDLSGSGRRVVYSNGQQRVWLVEEDGRVSRTYPVSGRKGDPGPGSYEVFSRSRHARSPAGARMEYMVRFARTSGLDIGFHAIPVGKGGPIQSEAELGQFRSKGCVRQSVPDAVHLWNWAPVGTTVVVTP